MVRERPLFLSLSLSLTNPFRTYGITLYANGIDKFNKTTTGNTFLTTKFSLLSDKTFLQENVKAVYGKRQSEIQKSKNGTQIPLTKVIVAEERTPKNATDNNYNNKAPTAVTVRLTTKNRQRSEMSEASPKIM